YVSVATVVAYSLTDLRAASSSGSGGLAGWLGSHLPQIPWTISAVPYGTGNLPGRLVALTFALVATRYYLNIFSTLSCRSQGGRLAATTEIVMRGVPVIFVVVVVVANATDPRLWPLFSAAAVWAALNNWLCHSLAARNLRLAKGTGSTTLGEDVKADVDEYGTWWWLMLAYSAGLGALAVAFALGIARDQLVDALAVALGINIVKLYVGNCGKLAPTVRACLGRAFSAGDRLSMSRQVETARTMGADI
ncbi:MAG: hypothetical protein LC749_21880, partial [Actinobacteria bacterium]|nr:hypothetical protein [Actinomycetota bacterium]